MPQKKTYRDLVAKVSPENYRRFITQRLLCTGASYAAERGSFEPPNIGNWSEDFLASSSVAIFPIGSRTQDMRRGELCAPRWKDVDLDRAKLHVEWSLEQTRSGLRFKAPKTQNGRRRITLPPMSSPSCEHIEKRNKNSASP
jgi:hypothetical protein